jgi:hypothetical protein
MKLSFFLTNKNVQAGILLDFIKDISIKRMLSTSDMTMLEKIAVWKPFYTKKVLELPLNIQQDQLHNRMGR